MSIRISATQPIGATSPLSYSTKIKSSSGGCSHGLPSGACPACSGGAGGGGSSTAKRAGEMSWGECYSVWMFMQALLERAKLQKQLDQIESITKPPVDSGVSKNQSIELLLGRLMENHFFVSVSKTVEGLKAVIYDKISDFKNTIANRIEQTLHQIKQMLHATVETVNKLVSILGEQLKLAGEFLENSFKKLKRTIFIAKVFQKSLVVLGEELLNKLIIMSYEGARILKETLEKNIQGVMQLFTQKGFLAKVFKQEKNSRKKAKQKTKRQYSTTST